MPKFFALKMDANPVQTQMAAATVTVDGQWLTISPEFCCMLGYSAAGLRSLSHDDLLPPEERQRMSAFREQLTQGKFDPAKIDTRYVHASGRFVPVEVKLSFRSGNKAQPACLELHTEDFELRKAKAQRLAEEAENCRLLLQSATGHAIMRLDEQGNVLGWNAGAERMFGYEEDEIIGCPYRMFFIPEDIAIGTPRKVLDLARNHGQAEKDVWQVRKDRTRFWASGIITPFHDRAGRITGFVNICCDQTDRKISAERALHLAQHDSLTGLPNRKKFHEELKGLIEVAKASGNRIGVILLDLDHFKTINDSLGHHSGDQLLKCVARRLIESVRQANFIARLSGDEFGIILNDVDGQQEVEWLASELLKDMSRPFMLGEGQVLTGVSMGIALFPEDASDAEQLLMNADLAMHRAKSLGRSTYVFYTDRLNDEAARRHALGEASRLALLRQEFDLYYQPQFALNGTETGCEICGVEALLRWHHPDMPMVTTGEFVALADETGLIVQLGEWVLRTACAQLRQWHDAGFHDVLIAINMSYRQIKERNFFAMLDQVFAETGVNPHCIELEITEGILMETTSNNTSLLHALKERGVKISIDDFGTGFSSLSYLKHFPVDSLKIDQAFIRHLPDNHNDASITSAIIGLGHSMNLRVVAEGIENERQARFLKERKCDCAQGYYFSKAVPSEEITRLLEERAKRRSVSDSQSSS